MKINVKLLFLSFNFLLSAVSLGSVTDAALDGGHESNSGGAFVCRDGNGGVQSVKLLDLFEGENLYSLVPMQSKATVAQLLEDALAKVQRASDPLVTSALGSPLSQALRPLLLKIQNEGISLPIGVGIAPPNDMEHELTMEGCPLEGAISWNDKTNKIYKNMRIISKMDNVSKAALYFHEAFYRLLRDKGGESTAVRTRKVTASVFSDAQLIPIGQGLPTQNVELCRSNNEIAYYRYNEAGKIYYQLIVAGLQPIISLTRFLEPDLTMPKHGIGVTRDVEVESDFDGPLRMNVAKDKNSPVVVNRIIQQIAGMYYMVGGEVSCQKFR